LILTADAEGMLWAYLSLLHTESTQEQQCLLEHGARLGVLTLHLSLQVQDRSMGGGRFLLRTCGGDSRTLRVLGPLFNDLPHPCQLLHHPVKCLVKSLCQSADRFRHLLEPLRLCGQQQVQLVEEKRAGKLGVRFHLAPEEVAKSRGQKW